MALQNLRVRSVRTEFLSHDLWDKALGTLGNEVRSAVHITKENRGIVLSGALKEVEKTRQICVQKRWTFKKRNGKTVILRDLFEKIIVWVEKFIAVGDAAIQYDPIHAAPAWAAIRFVLQMAVNEKRVFGEMVENIETVSNLITRYAILEELYLQRDSPARDKIEDTVVLLYAEILIFLAKAKEYFQCPTTIRVAKSIFQVSADERMAKINALDGQMSKLTEIFYVETQLDTAKSVAAMHVLLSSLNEPIQRLADSSAVSAQVLEERQCIQLLTWLSPVPFNSHHKQLSDSRIPGSGQWLLDHAQYVGWRSSSQSSIFLLHGILGSGKTALASAVIDSFLHESSGQTLPAPIAYFYCAKNSAESERRDPDEILRSIVRQLSFSHGYTSRVDDRILREYNRCQEAARVDGVETARLRSAECVRLILDTTAASPAVIVIDAIDEITSRLRHILLSSLNQIVKNSLSIVKIFLTSRDDTQIYAFLSDSVKLRIERKHNRKDIDIFVHEKVCSAVQNRRILNGAASEDLKQEMINALSAGAGEMFIWIVRQIEVLAEMKSEVDIKSAMRVLPQHTLHDLYERAFTQLSSSGEHSQGLAMHVFSMLLCAQEALSPEALIQSTVRPAPVRQESIDLERIVDICLNLIVLDIELNIVRFAHISFQEFLETKSEYKPQHTHKIAAMSCLEFCLEGYPIEMVIDSSPRDDFYRYSAMYWAKHCGIVVENGFDDLLTAKMREFMFDECDVALAFVDWNQALGEFAPKLPSTHALAKNLHSAIDSNSNPLFTACVFGLAPILDDLLLLERCDWNQKNDLGQSGLYLAAVNGHTSVVQILLRRQVDINISGGRFGHPLHAACANGHSTVVQLLLDHGANSKIGSRSALQYSFLTGHESVALILVTSQFSISDQAEYDSILQQSAEAGFTDLVRVLNKEFGSLYGELGSSRCRAIEVAIFKGRIGVVERYTKRLGDFKTELPADAIATAALGGQDDMIDLLIKQGLDLDKEGMFGTPLRAACLMRHEFTVRHLLQLGADLHISGSFGGPLQAAAMQGDASITQLLLSDGASVDESGGLYGSALQAAAHRGHWKVVEILLDAGADVYETGFSLDAFHAASEGGHEEIVQLFLDKGYKIRQNLMRRSKNRMRPPKSYKNLLREASPSRNPMSRPLQDPRQRSKGCDQQASTTSYSHILDSMRGVATSDFQNVKPHRKQFDDGRHGASHALSAAAANGHTSVVKLLLSQFSKMDISKSDIGAGLKEACKNGHLEVVKMMISEQIKAQDLLDAVEAAGLNGHGPVVDLLIYHAGTVGLSQVKHTRESSRGNNASAPGQETLEYDSIAHAVLISGAKSGNLSTFTQGQNLAAKRFTNDAACHSYGEALYTAAYHHNLNVMETVLNGDYEFDEALLLEVLNLVFAWGNVEALRLLLKHHKNMLRNISQYQSGVYKAIKYGNLEILSHWLEQVSEYQEFVVDSETVINAAKKKSLGILRLFIKQIRLKETFEEVVNQCLQVASRIGHCEGVEYLIAEGADPNLAVKDMRYTSELYDLCDVRHDKLTALQAALIGFERFESGSPSNGPRDGFQGDWTEADVSFQQLTLGLLLAKGADPNEVAEHQRYPLNIAAEYGTIETVQTLISAGADPEAATEKYGTALEAAARREVGSLPIIEFFLKSSEPTSPIHTSKIAALNVTLSYFSIQEGFDDDIDEPDCKFKFSNSLPEVLEDGPGAVIRTLLDFLPHEKANDSGYGHLAQMICVAGDQRFLELLLRRGLNVNHVGFHYGTALQAACRFGNVVFARCLLDSGADVNILHGEYGTALRAAALGGHEELVCLLIAHGADVNLCPENMEGWVATKDRDKSILHLALKSKNLEVFRTLLSANADINKQGPDQKHLLLAACKHGNPALVELLLANGADVNVVGDTRFIPEDERYNGITPLHVACITGQLSMVQLLLDHKVDIENTEPLYPTPLIEAIRRDQISIVNLLICAGADVNHAIQFIESPFRANYSKRESVDTKWMSPLSAAAMDCKLEILKLLLTAGAVVGGSSASVNALAEACYCSQFLASGLLFEAVSGTQNEAEVCGEAFFAAVEIGNEAMVCQLLDHDVYPTFEAVRRACAAGMLDAVKTMVGTGMDINQRDDNDAPLLQVAASHSKFDVVRFLIRQGADIKRHSTTYGNPLIAAMEGSLAPFLRCHPHTEACRSLAKQLPLPEHSNDDLSSRYVEKNTERPGYKEVSDCEQVVSLLLDAGADIDTSIRRFGNALHLASYLGSTSIVRQFLLRMENINISGGYFGSPLIAALRGNHPKIVEMLLHQDINVNWYEPGIGCAWHYACRYRSTKLIQLLLDYGADVTIVHEKCGSTLSAVADSVENDEDHEFYDNDEACDIDTKSSEEKCAVVKLLLRREPRIQIMNSDILAAAFSKTEEARAPLLRLLLRHDESLAPSEDVIIEIVQRACRTRPTKKRLSTGRVGRDRQRKYLESTEGSPFAVTERPKQDSRLP